MSIIFKPPISKLPIIVFLLTLSGLPSHMNLKHLLSISFLYLSGMTHALATKVNIGMTNALIIIIFPRIVKFRFPQEKNKVFILSILFSQFNFSLFFIVTKIYTQCFNRFFIPFNALYFIFTVLKFSYPNSPSFIFVSLIIQKKTWKFLFH